MSDYKWIVVTSLATASIGFGIMGCGRVSAQATTLDSGNREVDLTIYKEDFAMVSEKRPMDLPEGHKRLSIGDVSKQLDPNSVLFDWQGEKQNPEVVATTYDLGVGSGANLLRRLNGLQVEMMWPTTDGKPGETVSGRLEAAEQGEGFALRTKDKLYVNPNGTIVASAEAAASTLPKLAIEIDSKVGGRNKLRLSYLTRGMSWSADYVVKLDTVSSDAELECWATVTNTTGIPYPDAKLTLMTGSPNRAVLQGRARMEQMSPPEVAKAPVGGIWKDDAGFRRQSNLEYAPVGEIYAYKVPSTATIGQEQMNRISVLGTRKVRIQRDYAVRLPSLSPWGYDDFDPSRNHIPATLSISFINDGDSSLGIPLPAGDVRVYDKDADGNERFTGAAALHDTAKKEHVNLTLSNAFDVYGEYKVVKSERIDKHTLRKTLEVTLHNEKPGPIELRVVQGFSGMWKSVQESEPSRKLRSTEAQWKLLLSAGSERKISYVIDMKL